MFKENAKLSVLLCIQDLMLILYISELCRTDVTDLVHINTKMALDFGKLFLALANDTIEYQKKSACFFF